MSPNPTVTHEARSAAWNALWRVLLAPLPDEGSAPQTEPVSNDDEEADQAAA